MVEFLLSKWPFLMSFKKNVCLSVCLTFFWKCWRTRLRSNDLVLSCGDTLREHIGWGQLTAQLTQIFWRNSHKIPIKFPKNSQKIPKKFPKNSQKIHRKFPEIFQKIPRNFLEISQKFLRNFPKFSKKSPEFILYVLFRPQDKFFQRACYTCFLQFFGRPNKKTG